MYLIGYDIGSSSIKASLINTENGSLVASAVSPETELEITAVRPGWAEQHPEIWWKHTILATKKILAETKVNPKNIKAVGISYQMHGLVIVDKDKNPLRPSIIWCDSRAVEIGDNAFKDIGKENCLKCFLNSPGNFTASKLKWVKENEPSLYAKIYKMMLPGDYIAMKMSGQIKSTPSGMSEGIIWNFSVNKLALELLDYYDINYDFVPEIVPTFSVQGELNSDASEELGLHPGTLISYRAGDQPNNALSLNVLNPGDVAATAGTSGVIYSVIDSPNFDSKSRVNIFVHVNNSEKAPRFGVLLCINGTGILNRWLKQNTMGESDTYVLMNQLAAKAPAGSDGLYILPYGNGAERTLENKDIGASFHGLNFNTHNKSHLLRASQEGIVFAMNYGLEITRGIGVKVSKVRAGNTNMFLSPLFREIFAAVTRVEVELYNTDGSQGAARGAGIGADIYKSPQDAFTGLKAVERIEPKPELVKLYQEIYGNWLNILNSKLKE